MLLPGVESIALGHWNRSYVKSEAYAIPIQQVGYLVKYYPNRLSDNDYKVLSKIIDNPKETIKKNYNAFEVDEIKYNDNFYKFADSKINNIMIPNAMDSEGYKYFKK